MRRKKVAIAVVLLLAAVLAAALLIMGPRTAGTESADIADPSEVGTADKQQSDQQLSQIDDNEELFNQSQEKKLERIFKNTYVYYDEFLEGKPITYTFYEDGTMVVYYWEDTESESIPLSSQWAQYCVNDDVTDITLYWGDGTRTTEIFRIKKNAIVIGETEFQISDREIHLN